MDPIVALQNITKKFSETVVAVDNVSLEIYRGEFLTLLGPSGCGKTTTLRMIAGLETASAGTILINNEDVTFTPPYARDTSMMFQDYALFPHMTIEDNIAFGLKMRGVKRQARRHRARQMLDFVQLPDLARRKPDQLSGGQRQRVALARSLILEPAVLLLDEPLGALDAELRRQMQVELKRTQRRVGITFIYVTHDQEEALTMSDRIVVMRQGRIEQIGSAYEIYEQPRTAFVARFIGECNFRAGELVAQNDSIVEIDDPVLGPLRGQPSHSLALTNQSPVVTMAIRPEKIKLGDAAALCDNRGQGVIKEVAYKGASVQYIVEVAANDELIITAPNRLELAPETSLPLGWNSQDAIVLPSELSLL